MAQKEKKAKPQSTPKQERTVHSAETRAQAVLSVWSERRKPSEVCRELSIKWAVLSHWQDRALRGMVTALEPRSRKTAERSPALGPKLERLLERVSRTRGSASPLQKRLRKIQSETKAT